jgi:hypothetical protein
MLHKPQSPLTLLQAKLVAALETTDLRYGLSCYGDFLEHIPRRLGHSHALDVSADLMMSFFPYHYSFEIPSQVLAKYSSGLKVLRDPQDETGTKLNPEDVAAFHIIMICQVSTILRIEHRLIDLKSWLGQTDDGLKSHDKQVLTRFMDTVTEKGWSITFELQLLEASLVALFFEALVDPHIELESYVSRLRSQSRQNEYNSNQGPLARYFQVERLLRIPRFMHEPLCYMDEIKITYQELQDDHARILHHLESVRTQKSSSGDLHCRQKLIRRLQFAEAIPLVAALALNSILRATYPDDSILLLEASTLANELIALAKGVSKDKPLGASFIPPCLVAAVSHLRRVRSSAYWRLLITYVVGDYKCFAGPTKRD